MKSLAIVGSGIAGMGCAYLLRKDYQITIFDSADYVGGHTNTISTDPALCGESVDFDSGFMVFNHITYPLLTELFKELGVPTKKTDMSFSVQHLDSGIEWNGAGLDKIFAQRKNILNLRFLSMLKQLDWFNKNAPSHLNTSDAELTVRQYVTKHRLSDDFLNLYLVPMGSSVWSTPADSMLDFPAGTLIRFFYNHGFLGLDTHYQWYTVDGGAKKYVAAIRAALKQEDKILLGQAVTSVRASGSGSDTKAELSWVGGNARFDKVILACHADQTLALLSEPTAEQTKLLSPFKYQDNQITVHTDVSVMPKNRRAWASWNYRSLKNGSATVHYWMNNLQGLSCAKDYFVSLNSKKEIDPALVVKEMHYTHPLFDLQTQHAKLSLDTLNQSGPIYFCGSYFAYGFHEDAYHSAYKLSCALLKSESAMEVKFG